MLFTANQKCLYTTYHLEPKESVDLQQKNVEVIWHLKWKYQIQVWAVKCEIAKKFKPISKKVVVVVMAIHNVGISTQQGALWYGFVFWVVQKFMYTVPWK